MSSADVGALELDVVSDWHLLDPCVDDDNLSSCLPDCSAGSASSARLRPAWLERVVVTLVTIIASPLQ
jgi:hypothetical protein